MPHIQRRWCFFNFSSHSFSFISRHTINHLLYIYLSILHPLTYSYFAGCFSSVDRTNREEKTTETHWKSPGMDDLGPEDRRSGFCRLKSRMKAACVCVCGGGVVWSVAILRVCGRLEGRVGQLEVSKSAKAGKKGEGSGWRCYPPPSLPWEL